MLLYEEVILYPYLGGQDSFGHCLTCYIQFYVLERFDDFWAVNKKLMGNGQQNLLHIPIRFYEVHNLSSFSLYKLFNLVTLSISASAGNAAKKKIAIGLCSKWTVNWTENRRLDSTSGRGRRHSPKRRSYKSTVYYNWWLSWAFVQWIYRNLSWYCVAIGYSCPMDGQKSCLSWQFCACRIEKAEVNL